MELSDRRIYLSDLLYNSATLSEKVEVPPRTAAVLVVSMDGVEKREKVILDNGISNDNTLLSFSYVDPAKINGRNFPVEPYKN